MIYDWIVFGIGCALIIFSATMTPNQNFKSKMVFKVFPFFGGLYLMWYAAAVIGFIQYGAL